MIHHYHVVTIGGGGGATQVLKAVELFAARRTAIIAVTDTGRSTGLARRIHNIPAPGDLRATIAAFAEDTVIAHMLQHRLSGEGAPQLEGMAFGNMLLGTMTNVLGDFAAAVEHVRKLARCRVDVLPVSTANTQLCAELADGAIVETELAVRGLHKPPITRLFLSNAAAAYAPALEAIRDADLVVLGPGSLFTTVLANLLFDGVAEALQAARGAVVYVCNTTTQPGQTDGFTALDHVHWVARLVGPGALNATLINNSVPDPAALRQYEAEGLYLLQPTEAEIADIAALGVQPIVRELTETVGAKRALWNKQDTVRHDLEALGIALREALQ
jgi:uncharacterized cofD-like protein